MARKNPDTMTWVLLGAAAIGAYVLFGRKSKVAVAATTRAKSSPTPGSPPGGQRYQAQFFGKGEDRDFVCFDKHTRQYVDEQICETELQLEGVGNCRYCC